MFSTHELVMALYLSWPADDVSTSAWANTKRSGAEGKQARLRLYGVAPSAVIAVLVFPCVVHSTKLCLK